MQSKQTRTGCCGPKLCASICKDKGVTKKPPGRKTEANSDLTLSGWTEKIQPIKMNTRAPPAPTSLLLSSHVSTKMKTAIAVITRMYNETVTHVLSNINI